MKRFWTFLVLFAHINFGMFIPQVDEADQFDARYGRFDDINSLYEYIDETVLGNVDAIPEDEDDDQADFYNIAKTDPYHFTPANIFLKQFHLHVRTRSTYPSYLARPLPLIPIEVLAPPPKAC